MMHENQEKSPRSPLREEQFWLLTGGVLLLAFVAFSFAMFFTRSFMIPFVFSIFLCAMVSPIDNLIVVRWKLNRWLGFAGSILVILLIFFLFFFVTRFAISSISKAISDVSLSTSTSTSESFETTVDQMLERLGVKSKYVNAKRLIEPLREELPTILSESLTTCKKFVSCSTLVLLFSIFILMGRDPHIRVSNEIYNEIERSIQKYLNIKFFISLATGVCVYVIFSMMGVQMAFLFGLLAFVLNFIPSIGSIIATVLPLPILMLTTEMSHTGLLLAFLLPCLVQNFFGNLLEPKLQGQGLKLHPVTILLALGFWGVVWGPVGMLLAAPMTAAMRIILLEFKMTRWMAGVMGGKLPSMQRAPEDGDLPEEDGFQNEPKKVSDAADPF